MFSLFKNIDLLPALNPIGTPFIELLTVESTNNYAMALARAAMAQQGTAVFAHEQTKGKGQRNKTWASQKDMNIAMSVVVEPEWIAPSDIFLLSMMTAVAVREFINQYTFHAVKIKWANDVYWCDRKAAGILIENIWKGNECSFSIVGIGININQTHFDELDGKAVSLKQITGKNFEPVVLAKQLCKILEQKYQLLQQSSKTIVEEYKSHLYKLNETVKFKKQNRVFEATIKDVNMNGELVVQHSIEERFCVGEVEWMNNNP